MSTFRNILMASHYDDALTFEIVAEEDKDVFNLYFFSNKEVSTVFWGDGTSSIVGGSEVSHKYAPGTYTARLYLGSSTYTLCSLNSTVNIRSSNENWQRYPNLRNMVIHQCINSELLLTSIPDNSNDTRIQFCSNAILPITEIPPHTSSIWNFAALGEKALLPFSELPDSVTGNADGAFYNCREATFTITRLPAGITSLRQSFQFCDKATIQLDRLPPGITDLFCAFEGCSLLEMNLDEVVANAPAEGFPQLTNLEHTFTRCPGVTGSRSGFLALCPNAVTDSGTFGGTNTTE